MGRKSKNRNTYYFYYYIFSVSFIISDILADWYREEVKISRRNLYEQRVLVWQVHFQFTNETAFKGMGQNMDGRVKYKRGENNYFSCKLWARITRIFFFQIKKIFKVANCVENTHKK